MRIGVMLATRAQPGALTDIETRARELERMGFDSLWIPHVFGLDAITAAALVGRATERIEIGTAVVPVQPRHPAATAQAALTANAASRGRFTLGIGLSHPVVIEAMYGLPYARPARHMREQMALLEPLLRGHRAEHRGAEISGALELDVPGGADVPVLIGALGERMLRIAGERAAGTILWMTGPRTIARHIVPTIAAAARDAGRPSPRVVAGVNVLLTTKVDEAHAKLGPLFETYRSLPSYRAMIEREGSDDVRDYVLAGDESALDAGLDRLADAGVTELEAYVGRVEPGGDARTLEYLADRARRAR